jgi:hypothetical protein
MESIRDWMDVFSPLSLTMGEYYRGKEKGKRGRWKSESNFQDLVSGILSMEPRS